jgi:hypothetical protein
MLRFIDSFDHYALTNLSGKWTTASVSSSASGIGTTVAPRTGAACLYLADTDYIGVTSTGGPQATLLVGLAFRYTAAIAESTYLLTIGDQGVLRANNQVGVAINSGGTLTLYRNNDASTGTLPGAAVGSAIALGTTTAALAVGAWNYLELSITIHNSAGAAELRINGVSALTLSSVDTQFTANATANVVGLGGARFTNPYAFDDFYLADTVAGDGVTTFLGPQKIVAVIASAGNGTHTDWTPSTGTDHGALVDEATPNGDTDYVSSSTVGHRDSFNFAALGITGVVTAVQAVGWARNSDAGARTINHCTRIASTTYDGGTNTALDVTYRAARQVWTTSPATAAAWTIAEIDAAEFGVRIEA